MEIKTVDYHALSLIGPSVVVQPGDPRISELWGVLFARQHEILGQVGGPFYGVSGPMSADGSFSYSAAVEASGEPPAGMVKLSYPPATYAVFPCTMPTIPEVYGQIFGEWLPASAWQMAGDYSLEVYGADFDPSDPKSVFHVYVPVAAR